MHQNSNIDKVEIYALLRETYRLNTVYSGCYDNIYIQKPNYPT
jgi:hypothetical protein